MPTDSLQVEASSMRTGRWLWLLAVVAGTAVYLLEPDADDLFEMCATQGQPIIYRTVAAKGYFYGATDDCWGCWRYLENSDYSFIEFSIATERPDYDVITAPGIYRVSRIQAGSPQCHEELTSHYTRGKMMRDIMERNKWCFQVERFEYRQARYGFYRKSLGTVRSSPVTGSRISATRSYWLDHDLDQVIAEYTNYALSRYPFLRLSSFGSRKHCNTFINKLGPRGIDRRKIVHANVETME